MDKAREELASQQEAFDMFSKEQVERIPVWQNMVHAYEKDPTQKNPYEIKVEGAHFSYKSDDIFTHVRTGLTEAQVRLQFVQDEAKATASGIPPIHDVSPIDFISLGLELEDEQ